MQETNAQDRLDLSEKKKEIRMELTASLMTPAGGIDAGGNRTRDDGLSVLDTASARVTRMTVATQGGNALLASRYGV